MIGTSANGSGSQPKQRKRQVSVATFQKRQSQQEKEHKTLSWLRCDKQQKHVETLWCATCRRFDDRIRGAKNFSTAWITGSTNQNLSNVLDHARSEQHKSSMSLVVFTQDVLVQDKISPYHACTKFARVNACSGPDPRVSTHLFSPAFEVGSGPGLSFIPC